MPEARPRVSDNVARYAIFGPGVSSSSSAATTNSDTTIRASRSQQLAVTSARGRDRCDLAAKMRHTKPFSLDGRVKTARRRNREGTLVLLAD